MHEDGKKEICEVYGKSTQISDRIWPERGGGIQPWTSGAFHHNCFIPVDVTGVTVHVLRLRQINLVVYFVEDCNHHFGSLFLCACSSHRDAGILPGICWKGFWDLQREGLKSRAIGNLTVTLETCRSPSCWTNTVILGSWASRRVSWWATSSSSPPARGCRAQIICAHPCYSLCGRQMH